MEMIDVWGPAEIADVVQATANAMIMSDETRLARLAARESLANDP
jgi:hypothetical protein